MKLFIDSSNLEEIKEISSYGILDGVTTNPSLIKKEVERIKKQGIKTSLEYHIKKILKIAKPFPVSLEVIGSDYKEMIKESLILYKKFNPTSKNVIIKIPVNPCLESSCSTQADGIKAIKFLSSKKIPVNTTLIFTPEQSLLAAKAGAKFVSPFVGREDDYLREMNRMKFNKQDYFPKKGIKKLKKIHNDNGIVSGVDLIEKTRILFDKSNIKTEILAASIRNKRQFREVALAGADIATLPFSVIKSLLSHHKTAEGMKKFTKDIIPEYAKIAKQK
jgi:transaldolase